MIAAVVLALDMLVALHGLLGHRPRHTAIPHAAVLVTFAVGLGLRGMILGMHYFAMRRSCERAVQRDTPSPAATRVPRFNRQRGRPASSGPTEC